MSNIDCPRRPHLVKDFAKKGEQDVFDEREKQGISDGGSETRKPKASPEV